jgi:hypothetical protein
LNQPKTTKLCSKKTGRVKRTNFWMNPAAEEHLRFLARFYEKNLGRPVSTSLIARRALEALSGHIKALKFHRSEAELKAEASGIVKHIR